MPLFVGIVALCSGCDRRPAAGAELILSGNIEVVDAQLGFKIPGRVVDRPVFEGDQVKAGQLVARLDDVDQVQQLAVRRAELAGAEAVLAELEAGARPQEIASAQAAVRSAEAELERARLDFERQDELLRNAAISRREFELAQAQVRVAEARAADTRERLKLVREGPRVETIAQARARVQQARAAVDVAETQVAHTRLHSPVGGTVVSHNVEVGEYVSPGTPVVTVADLSQVWVRTYLDQTELGRLKHGQKVSVRTDAFPERTFEGTIGFISSEAEFTPKTVQTAKERVKLVFRIKVDIANPKGELKPGMAADVVVK